MSTPHDVLTGLWTDYSGRNKTQLLLSDFWAQWMKSLVAVALALSGPYIFKILKSFLIWPGEWWVPASQQPERQPLLGRSRDSENTDRADNTRQVESSLGDGGAPQGESSEGDVEAHQDNRVEITQHQNDVGPRAILKRSKGGRETLKNFYKNALQKGVNITDTTLMIIFATLLFASFIAQIIAGVFSTKVATDRAARSSSTHCGIWAFDVENAGDEAAARADFYDYQKEERAGEYAQNCYGSRNATTIDSMPCDFFYQPNIKFSSKSMDRCPFGSHELCLGGLYSAVTFDTGLVDASHIGINAKPTHKFRRKTTCSPLNMDYPYVRNESSARGSNDTTYYYYYGSINDDMNIPPTATNYSYKTSGNPFEWLAPVYSVNTYSTSLYPEEDYWRPIPKLAPPENYTLTIIFVSSMHIYHMKPSYDPIFPAAEPHYIEGFHGPYYYNSDPRARPLACVDTTELCSPNGKTCWPMTADVPGDVLKTPAYWLMKWSLEASTIYDSIAWRLGTALLAQEKVSQSRSQPLSDNHWEAEARRLFATSLARIQFDAWSIARGEDRELPGYVEVTPDEGRGQLCGLYKFKSIGYTNINLAAFIGLMLAPFAILFLSLEAKKVKDFFRRCSSCRRKGTLGGDRTGDQTWEPLVIHVLLENIILAVLLIPYAVIWCSVWLYRKLH